MKVQKAFRAAAKGFKAPLLAAAVVGYGISSSPTMAADDVIDAMMFKDICAETLPSFRKAPSALAKMPFDKDAAAPRYRHRKLDMTVEVGRLNGALICRMTIVNGDNDADSPMMFAVAAFSEVWQSDHTVVREYEEAGHLVVSHPKGHIFTADFARNSGKKVFVATIQAAE